MIRGNNIHDYDIVGAVKFVIISTITKKSSEKQYCQNNNRHSQQGMQLSSTIHIKIILINN